MSNGEIVENDFKLITYKRSRKTPVSPGAPNVEYIQQPLTEPDKEALIRRVEEARRELLASDLFASAVASLREGLCVLNNPQVREIVCLGLGRIGECMTSRYQFAFLLCLKQHYGIDSVKVYDPLFAETERWLLTCYDCTVLESNCEGKYGINNKRMTIFYMPHCPKQLTNNLLWANWGLDLNYCIVIANSFNEIVEKTSKRELYKTAEYVANIVPYVLELALINSFKYFEIFNDTAIHVFPWHTLKLISADFWSFNSEPHYSDDDVEFVKSRVEF